MKSLVLLCFLAMISLGMATIYPYERGCIYILGRCYRDCKVGTQAYHLRCGRITPEPTCDEPNPVQQKEITCDYSECYCIKPTLRDTTTGHCVYPQYCPKTKASAVIED